MSLSSYKPKRKTITIDSDTEFSIRALDLSDVRAIINEHLVALDAMMENFAQKNADVFTTGMDDVGGQLIRTLVTDAPDIAAHIIALAADEPDAIEQAASLPLPVMLNTIIEIGNATFTDHGGPKKFFGMVAMVWTGIKGAIPSQPLSLATPATENRKARRSRKS